MLNLRDISRKHITIAGVSVILIALVYIASTQFESEPVDFVASGGSRARCNVGVISINGQLATFDSEQSIDSLRIAQAIRGLDTDRSKGAVVLLINSAGGSASAAEEISQAVKDLDVPSVAFVREYALSGGYWVAASTDHIVALSSSLIGSIGVTASYLEETELNYKEGYTYREITSGEYKDVPNPNKQLTARHREFLQSNVDDLFEIFKSTIKEYRGLTDADIARIEDAKFYIAEKAQESKLIDQIGGITEVKAYLARELSVDVEDLLLCEPEVLDVESSKAGLSDLL